MADGYSVQEMLKVVSMLYNAVKSNKADHANEDVTERSFDVSNKVIFQSQQQKLCRLHVENDARYFSPWLYLK